MTNYGGNKTEIRLYTGLSLVVFYGVTNQFISKVTFWVIPACRLFKNKQMLVHDEEEVVLF